MFDPLVDELSQRYGLNDRGRDLFALLIAYIHNDRRGGFGGFIESFREQGHGELLTSWLGNTQASGLNASDVGTVFGQGLLNDWATRLGVSRATVAAAIAGVLPRLVAEMTPGGRIPGGFAPIPGSITDRARWQTFADAAGVQVIDQDDRFSVRPGVEDLIGAASRDRDPSAPHFGTDKSALSPAATNGRQSPGWNEVAADRSARMAPASREPPQSGAPAATLAAARPDATARYGTVEYHPGIRDELATPLPQSARQEPVFRETVSAMRSPAEAYAQRNNTEQRIADMAAAFDAPARRTGLGSELRADVRPEGWRPAVHPPRKRSWGWLGWLVLLLAIGAGIVWYAWTLGLLDPYIKHYQLPIKTSPASH